MPPPTPPPDWGLAIMFFLVGVSIVAAVAWLFAGAVRRRCAGTMQRIDGAARRPETA
jgi:hypothetical protein